MQDNILNDGWIPTWKCNPDNNIRCEVTFSDGTTGFATWIRSNNSEFKGRWYKVAITIPAQVIAWRKRLEPYME